MVVLKHSLISGASVHSMQNGPARIKPTANMFIILGFFSSLLLYSIAKNRFFKALEKTKDTEYS